MEVKDRLSLRAKILALAKRWWRSFAKAVGDFFEEGAYRIVLAFRVLFGLVPIEVERRPWDRTIETPALLDVFDWTNDRLIFSVIVWPPLESDISEADDVFYQRISQVKRTIYKGAQELALTTSVETTYGLRWDPGRVCWVDRDHHGYDGNREILSRERRKKEGS